LSRVISAALGGRSAIDRPTQAKGATPAIFAASGAAILGAALAIAPTMPAQAQDQAAPDSLETVVVTGTRIPRQDFSANAPIVSVARRCSTKRARSVSRRS
jgi:hypothetical protein